VPGVLIEWRADADERIDIRDGYQDSRRAVIGTFTDRQLIEIARIVVVDRAPRKVAPIGHVIAGWSVKTLGLLDRSRREVRLQAALEHRLARQGCQVSGFHWVSSGV
jgi:hypothetical protein